MPWPRARRCARSARSRAVRPARTGALGAHSRSRAPAIMRGFRHGTRPDAPRIAVIIPCHGEGRLLAEAVASIQEPEPVHIVVVDDVSPDEETRRTLAELEAAGAACCGSSTTAASGARAWPALATTRVALRLPARRRRPRGARRVVEDGRPARRGPGRRRLRRRHARVRRQRAGPRGAAVARPLPGRLHERVPDLGALPARRGRGDRRLVPRLDRAAGLRGLEPVDGPRGAGRAHRAPRPGRHRLPPAAARQPAQRGGQAPSRRDLQGDARGPPRPVRRARRAPPPLGPLAPRKLLYPVVYGARAAVPFERQSSRGSTGSASGRRAPEPAR